MHEHFHLNSSILGKILIMPCRAEGSHSSLRVPWACGSARVCADVCVGRALSPVSSQVPCVLAPPQARRARVASSVLLRARCSCESREPDPSHAAQRDLAKRAVDFRFSFSIFFFTDRSGRIRNLSNSKFSERGSTREGGKKKS